MPELGQHKNNNPEQKKRTKTPSKMTVGGGVFRIPRGKGGLILLVIVIIASYYQANISDFFAKKNVAEPVAEVAPTPDERVMAPDNEATEFTTSIIATLTETWQSLFQARGLSYQPPKVVMYREPVRSACYPDQLAIGTFYCPDDNQLYISLALYDEMKSALGPGGDFAQGYVIAHAVGHHIQQQLKLESDAKVSPEQELQADCFAGLWGHRMAEQQILSAGDLQQALDVAQVIDKQQHSLHSGMILPESFSYAPLEQRYQWFNRGFVSGELAQCLNFDPAAVKP